jgi:hypothetical protein
MLPIDASAWLAVLPIEHPKSPPVILACLGASARGVVQNATIAVPARLRSCGTRSRMHGGLSTGPKTKKGLRRSLEAARRGLTKRREQIRQAELAAK